jgi:hypothetical protein
MAPRESFEFFKSKKEVESLHEAVEKIHSDIVEFGPRAIKRFYNEVHFKQQITPADLEALTTLPIEIGLVAEGEKFVAYLGSKKAVHTPSEGTHFILHSHRGDIPAVSSDDNAHAIASKVPEFIASRYGITMVGTAQEPVPTLKDIGALLRDGSRGHIHKIETRQRAQGISEGFVHFTEKEKMALICDFFNRQKPWEEVAQQLKS